MAKVKNVEIRCKECGAWFRSPINFGGTDSFDTSTLIGNQVQCRSCGKMTGCDKENMRVHFDDGGFVGKATS